MGGIQLQLTGAEAGRQEQLPRAQLAGSGAGAGASVREQLCGTVAGEKLAGAEAEGEWVLEQLYERGHEAEGEREVW